MPGQQRSEELHRLLQEAKEIGLLPELMMQEAISSVALDNDETARAHVVESVRLAAEVTAGLIPEQPEQEYTKRYVVTSDDWYKLSDKEKQVKLAEVYGEAIGYAQLLINPSRFNWVRVDWIYF